MMIDGGTWKGTKSHLSKYVRNLKKYVSGHIDLLVITHEHKDHVYLFDACSDLFTKNFTIDEVWMAWSEDDQNDLVKEWKDKFGQKKKALAIASDKISLAIQDEKLTVQLSKGFNGTEVVKRFKKFSSSLNDFKELHFSVDSSGKYKGGLKGMEIIKKQIAKDNIKYCKPGEIESISKLPGIKFHILGPPESFEAIKKEHGKKGSEDTYDHNKVLKRSDSFSAVITEQSSAMGQSPFDEKYNDSSAKSKNYYNQSDSFWRTIDLDWLVSGAGNLALRVNTGINNLSLAMAIEFEDSGRVMLFPGDAEFGSWESWHNIEWNKKGKKGKHLTEDLLNRTVFYKVAHHLSHNGTAKEKGLEMMTSSDLVAMATLDFEAISSNWKSTMPNRGILKDLINKTKGRLIIMNEKDLFYDFDEKVTLKDKIESERLRLNEKQQKAFKKSFKETKLYKQYTVQTNLEN
ncbi:hypothetical protein SAMN04488514_10686 [Kriegella aquimaris]|uniref:Metallo-beta-lactamase superfamily protein n=2 Tax=Kriegella aquimaris TaxID=192904 RepID=A0A1G9RD06_9FLAO|nr:hypothetical protein SAMN04488514_10686 [Kriegella aquimaris]